MSTRIYLLVIFSEVVMAVVLVVVVGVGLRNTNEYSAYKLVSRLE